MNLYEKIQELGVVPVIKIDNAQKNAKKLAKSLIDGGLPVAEITFRTDSALDAINIIKKEFPQMILGAGTVLSIDQAKLAINAGVDFIVSPGLNPLVVKFCNDNNMPIFPGCITPTEIETALSLDLKYLKFFPASQFGGINTINALCAPYTMVKFMPTGGVTLDNLSNYLESKNVFACGGTFIATEKLLNDENYDQIKINAQKCVAIVSGLKK